MNYRMAQSCDAAKLAALSIEVWLNSYAKLGISTVYADYVLERFTAAHFQEIIADQNRELILCENAGYLLGYVALDFKADLPAPILTATPADSAAEISTLYVRSRHHSKGIGQALMEQARCAAIERQRSFIWLSVLHDNQHALEFYNKQGMHREGSIWFELSDQRHENYVLTQQL